MFFINNLFGLLGCNKSPRRKFRQNISMFNWWPQHKIVSHEKYWPLPRVLHRHILLLIDPPFRPAKTHFFIITLYIYTNLYWIAWECMFCFIQELMKRIFSKCFLLRVGKITWFSKFVFVYIQPAKL